MSKKAISGEVQMFGMSEADIRSQYMESSTASLCGLEMVVMGLLSDAQELQTFGIDLRTAAHAVAIDQSRKNMNIAKFILCEMMDKKETV